MARRRRSAPRRRRRYFSRPARRRSRPSFFSRFRRKDKRFPMSVGIGLATSVLAPPSPGWGSVMSKVQAGQLDQALQSFVKSWTGFGIGGIGGLTENQFDIMGLINPFNMAEAPALKATLWSAIAMKISKKIIGKDPMSRVPILNKWIKFS